MTDRDDELRELKDALEAKALSLIGETMGEAQNRALSNRRIARWGRKGSFVYHLAGPMRGRWHDFEAGDHGDLLALIQRHHARDFSGALRWARQWLGWADGYRPEPRKSYQLRLEREKKRAEQEAEQARVDAAKTSNAQRIAGGSIAPIDTLGEAYLHGRGIYAHAWPDAIRWHEEARAVVFSVTDDDGIIVAVQMVAVTPDGKQDKERIWDLRRPDDKRPKSSTGPISKGAVRLPGRYDGPICITEGPETAGAVWSSTGYETFAVLGSMSRIGDIASRAIKSGRRIIICRDDDARTSPAAKAVRSGVKAIKALGGDVREAWPFEVRRGNKQDFNDLLIESGPDAVRRRIDQVAIDLTPIARISMSLDVAQRRIDEIVGSFFDRAAGWQEGMDPNIEALGISVGTGKTEAALRHALRRLIAMRAADDERAIAISVPEHRLSDEIAKRFEKMARDAGVDLRAAVRRGREAINPASGGNEPMCVNLDDIKEAQALYADPDKDVCASCPFANGCAYLRQKDVDADLFIVSHSALFGDMPANISRRKVAALVVDESPWSGGFVGIDGRPIDIPLDSLRPGVMPVPPGDGPEGGARLEDIRRLLAASCDQQPNGDLRRDALIDAGFDADTGHVAHKLEWRRKVDNKAEPNWRMREPNRTLGRTAALWRGIIHHLEHPEIDASGRIELTHDSDGVRVLRVRGRRDIAEGWRGIPTMLIDARLDVELVRYYWPTIVEVGRFDVRAPHQKIRQAINKAWAKTYLEPKEDDTPDVARAKERQRKKARAIIMAKVRAVGGNALVISNKSVINALDLPPHIFTAHYGAVAGRDTWTNKAGKTVAGVELDLVILLGRQSPKVHAVEKMAGALTGRSPTKIENPTGMYMRADTERLIWDGDQERSIPAESDHHPDPIAERIRKSVTDGELIQAIGRGRGVRRGPENPLEVLVLTDVVLPIPIDELLPDEAIQATTPIDRMMAEGGIAFEDGTSAAMFYPSLWRNPSAFRMATLRSKAASHSLIDIPIRESDGPFALTFQRAGNGQRPQRAYYDPTIVPDPRSALEAVFGSLARFELVEPAAEPVRVVARGAGHSLIEAGARQPIAITAPIAEMAVAQSFAGAIVLGIGAVEKPDRVEIRFDDGDAVEEPDWPALRDRLRDTGIPHGDLATKWCGISQSHLSNMECGRRKVTPEVAAALAQFLAETQPTQTRLL